MCEETIWGPCDWIRRFSETVSEPGPTRDPGLASVSVTYWWAETYRDPSTMKNRKLFCAMNIKRCMTIHDESWPKKNMESRLRTLPKETIADSWIESKKWICNNVAKKEIVEFWVLGRMDERVNGNFHCVLAASLFLWYLVGKRSLCEEFREAGFPMRREKVTNHNQEICVFFNIYSFTEKLPRLMLALIMLL